MNTHMRRRFVRPFRVLLGAGLWGLLLGPIPGAITLSHADAPQPPSQRPSHSPSRPPSPTSKINRALPGAHTGMLLMVKDNTVTINGISYVLAPGVLIETHSGHPLHVLQGWEKKLHYPVPVQYWLGPQQTAITQMIVSLHGKESSTPR